MTKPVEVTQADYALWNRLYVSTPPMTDDEMLEIMAHHHHRMAVNEATRELVDAVGPIIRYHSSGGHEGDGSDAAIKRAENALAKHKEAANG